MKKRIFWSILLSCFLTLLVTAAFVTSVLYVNSWEEYKREIETEVLYVGEAVNVMDASDGEASRYLEEVAARKTASRSLPPTVACSLTAMPTRRIWTTISAVPKSPPH